MFRCAATKLPSFLGISLSLSRLKEGVTDSVVLALPGSSESLSKLIAVAPVIGGEAVVTTSSGLIIGLEHTFSGK